MIEIPADVVVIGLGGNVGDAAAITERFRRARAALAELGDVKSAPLYLTAPIGPEQPPFLNTAVRVRWPGATAAEIIHTVLELEQLLGRDRRAETRWGPRPIDLDVLVWGAQQRRWEGPPELEVPHSRLAERRFVLEPLVDLLGEEVAIPGTHSTAGALLRRVTAQAAERIAETW